MKHIYLLISIGIILLGLSGCTVFKQGADDVIIRDPDHGTKVIKTYELENFDTKKELEELWLYASFSSDIYLSLDDKNRLITTQDKWKLYCTNKVKTSLKCSYQNVGEKGMEYEVWINENENKIIISFRGTDFDEGDDWRSNLRWFIPGKEKDQYDAVGTLTSNLVEELRLKYKNAKIITTGHSLGGGLAQRAAYSSKEIRLTYAFDPSMVTGFFDVFNIFNFLSYQEEKEINIYRVFEHGEVLAYPRWIMKIMFPLSKTNPRISELRFNYMNENIIAQHSMQKLAIKLRKTFKVDNKAISPNKDKIDY